MTCIMWCQFKAPVCYCINDCLALITSLYMKYGGSDTIQCFAIKFSITTNDKDIFRCLGTYMYKVHGKQSFWNFLSFRFKGNVNMVMSCHVLDLYLNVINERVRYVLIVLSFQSKVCNAILYFVSYVLLYK